MVKFKWMVSDTVESERVWYEADSGVLLYRTPWQYLATPRAPLYHLYHRAAYDVYHPVQRPIQYADSHHNYISARRIHHAELLIHGFLSIDKTIVRWSGRCL